MGSLVGFWPVVVYFWLKPRVLSSRSLEYDTLHADEWFVVGKTYCTLNLMWSGLHGDMDVAI